MWKRVVQKAKLLLRSVRLSDWQPVGESIFVKSFLLPVLSREFKKSTAAPLFFYLKKKITTSQAAAVK